MTNGDDGRRGGEEEPAHDAWVQRFLDARDAGRAPELDEFLASVPEELREVVRADCARWLQIEDEVGAPHLDPRRSSLDIQGYRELEFLSEGGMSLVWRAKRQSDGAPVAIKTLKARFLESREYRERFAREAKVGHELSHESIVPVLETGEYQTEYGTTPYFVMPLIAGSSVADRLRDRLEDGAGPFDARDVARIAIAVLEALEHCHAQKVVHRDLKPGNILLDDDERPKLIDFGLARFDLESSLTQVGALVGTLSYVSPEQAIVVGKHPIDARTDVYSLGAVMYAMLTGKPPFAEREDSNQLLRDIIFSDPEAPSRVVDRLHTDIETICLKALEKSPQHRYQSAREMREDIERFVRSERIHARPVRALVRVGRKFTRRKALSSAIGGAAAAALGIGTWSILRDTRPRIHVPAPDDCRVCYQPFVLEDLRYGQATYVGTGSVRFAIDPGRHLIGIVRSPSVFAEISVFVDGDLDLTPRISDGLLGLREVDAVTSAMYRVEDGARFIAGGPESNYIDPAYKNQERNALPYFAIDRNEVSWADFKQFIRAVPSAAPAYMSDGRGAAASDFKDAEPLALVSRADAERYATWAGKRLPTMLEWERVARGTNGRTQPDASAERIDEVSLGRGAALDFEDKDVILAAFRRNVKTSGNDPLAVDGVHHLYGNVSEYVDEFRVNERGEHLRDEVMIKGGSWSQAAIAARFDMPGYAFEPTADRGLRFGFRCARSLVSPLDR